MKLQTPVPVMQHDPTVRMPVLPSSRIHPATGVERHLGVGTRLNERKIAWLIFLLSLLVLATTARTCPASMAKLRLERHGLSFA